MYLAIISEFNKLVTIFLGNSSIRLLATFQYIESREEILSGEASFQRGSEVSVNTKYKYRITSERFTYKTLYKHFRSENVFLS